MEFPCFLADAAIFFKKMSLKTRMKRSASWIPMDFSHGFPPFVSHFSMFFSMFFPSSPPFFPWILRSNPRPQRPRFPRSSPGLCFISPGHHGPILTLMRHGLYYIYIYIVYIYCIIMSILS